MRDQTRRVYAWEQSFGDWNIDALSDRAMRRLIRKAERLFRAPPSKIVTRRNMFEVAFCAATERGRTAVVVGRHTHNAASALHEIAHAITWKRAGVNRVAPHGPEWLGVYLTLLMRAGVAPRSALYASARAKGLRWSMRLVPKRLKRA
jgi:hypothetical protein